MSNNPPFATFVYVNNHFSGHVPKTVADFLQLWGTGENHIR
jgi:hypothetical protein